MTLVVFVTGSLGDFLIVLLDDFLQFVIAVKVLSPETHQRMAGEEGAGRLLADYIREEFLRLAHMKIRVYHLKSS